MKCANCKRKMFREKRNGKLVYFHSSNQPCRSPSFIRGEGNADNFINRYKEFSQPV